MGHSSIQITLDVYATLEEKDVQQEFFSMVKNKNYDFYALDRTPEVVEPNDAEGELSEPDIDELPDDDDEGDEG